VSLLGGRGEATPLSSPPKETDSKKGGGRKKKASGHRVFRNRKDKEKQERGRVVALLFQLQVQKRSQERGNKRERGTPVIFVEGGGEEKKMGAAF